LKYKNAKDLLPEWLLNTIQEYAQGEVIYIPRKETVRTGWGQANGASQKYAERNREIIRLFQNGATLEELSERFYLSEHSIKKILGQKGSIIK
jgi:Mor family transcriptional regulator